jgi:hypothetical protein
MLGAHGAFQFRIVEARAPEVEQIKLGAVDAPAGADAEIREFARLVGGVPALHDALEGGRQLVRPVAPEPVRLDHAAAERRRRLLVLAGEVIFADRAPDPREYRQTLARRVQRLADPPRKHERPQQRLDPMRLVGLGDRRKSHHLPVLLHQHMAGEVVFVQPVHDQHDGTSRLVVEPAVEGVVVPFVGGPPARVGERLLGLQRVRR